MSRLLQPFVGYIPSSDFGSRLVGPPSATLTKRQKAKAKEDPLSFRFVAGRKAGCSHEDALAWLDDCRREQVLLPVGPALVVYRQEQDGFSATGVLGDLSLTAYDEGRVKRHEKTVAKTLQKMTDYMQTTRVLGNPTVTATRSSLSDHLIPHTEGPPSSAFTTVDGVSHSLWVVDGDRAEELADQIGSELYITDGHHRLAAASSAAKTEQRRGARIPAGVFSADQFRLRSFARCISDPDFDVDKTTAMLDQRFDLAAVTPSDVMPGSRFEFGTKVGDRFFRLQIPDEQIPDDPYTALNTNLLQNLILEPVFGINKPRIDKRLSFVADLGNVPEACADYDAWFLPSPLSVRDVASVADSARTMPAKSTWFAPKLPSGLVIRPMD